MSRARRVLRIDGSQRRRARGLGDEALPGERRDWRGLKGR
jgi:hypothetical protein